MGDYSCGSARRAVGASGGAPTALAASGLRRRRRSLHCRAHGLTGRETELVELLAGGADTRAIAAALFLSQHTVEDHLKSIFAEIGTRNRRTLASRVVGR